MDVAGLRVAGLGGCRRYRHGPNQYTDRQQARRGRSLIRRGFSALNSLVTRLQPGLLLHGHVRPAEATSPDRPLGRTIVRNVTGWHLLDIEPGARLRPFAAGSRHA